jgi:hypothetical protein
MLEQVRRWVNRLPATSRDLPILYAEGRYWTPNEILRQIESCPVCPTSSNLQRLLETRGYGGQYGQYGMELWQIAKQRLLKALEQYPVLLYSYSLVKPVMTTADLKREITAETPTGVRLIELETRRMQRELMLYG